MARILLTLRRRQCRACAKRGAIGRASCVSSRFAMSVLSRQLARIGVPVHPHMLRPRDRLLPCQHDGFERLDCTAALGRLPSDGRRPHSAEDDPLLPVERKRSGRSRTSLNGNARTFTEPTTSSCWAALRHGEAESWLRGAALRDHQLRDSGINAISNLFAKRGAAPRQCEAPTIGSGAAPQGERGASHTARFARSCGLLAPLHPA